MNRNYVPIAVFIVGVIVLTAFFAAHNKANAPTVNTTTATSTGTTGSAPGTPKIGGTMATSSNGKVLATGSLSGTTIAPPSLTGGIIISPSTSADLAAQLQTKEQSLIAQLKTSPNRLDLWLELGVYRKEAGDYAGAIAAWNYVAAAGPASISYSAYGNLGDLYENFDVNYPKAESNYLEAIKINPTYIPTYVNLYMMYKYQYKTNTTAAADLLARGLKANPGNAQLLALQNQ